MPYIERKELKHETTLQKFYTTMPNAVYQLFLGIMTSLKHRVQVPNVLTLGVSTQRHMKRRTVLNISDESSK